MLRYNENSSGSSAEEEEDVVTAEEEEEEKEEVEDEGHAQVEMIEKILQHRIGRKGG